MTPDAGFTTAVYPAALKSGEDQRPVRSKCVGYGANAAEKPSSLVQGQNTPIPISIKSFVVSKFCACL